VRHGDYVPSDMDIGGQHGLGKQDGTGSDRAPPRDANRRIQHSGVPVRWETLGLQAPHYASAGLTSPNADDEASVRVLDGVFDRTEHRNTVDAGAVQRSLVVQEANHAMTPSRLNHIQHLACEAACR
jgi:hypothetical protein